MIAHPDRISPEPPEEPAGQLVEVEQANTYAEKFTDASFWQKLRGYARIAGYEVTEKALYLYYAVQDPAMPKWAKTVVYGALGYFILPADAIADVLPGVGFTDDLGALAAALAVVVAHITPEVKAKARRKLSEWFDPPEVS